MFSGQDDTSEKRGAKQAVNTKAGTERRQRQLMSVRHKVHGDLMKHLRSEPTTDGAGENTDEAIMDVWKIDANTPPEQVSVTLLPHLRNMLTYGNANDVQQGMLLVRKMLSVTREPPYVEVLNSGVVPRIIELLEVDSSPQVQFEAAWALTNLAAGTSEVTMALITYGVIPPLVKLMYSSNADCCDQACWAIGNIAGENQKCCQAVIDAKGIDALLYVLSLSNHPITMLRNVVWALSNICRSRASVDAETMKSVLSAVATLINHQDEQVVVDALWTISYVSDGNSDRVQAVIDAGLLPRIVYLLSLPSAKVQMPAIRIIGNLAAGTDDQTQYIINSGALPLMCGLLSSPKRALRKETCWTVSNIAAGQSYQVDALISANIFQPLLNCMKSPELDVKKEAVWAVANVTFCGNTDQMRYLISIGTIKPLCATLETSDAKIITVALEALQLFLQLGEDDKKNGRTDTNLVADEIVENGAVTLLERLQSHNDTDVYSMVYNILHNFFNTEESLLGMDNEMGEMEGAFGNHTNAGPNGFHL